MKGKEETSTSFGKVIRRTVFFPSDTLASDEPSLMVVVEDLAALARNTSL
jgi:hypothetical protein